MHIYATKAIREQLRLEAQTRFKKIAREFNENPNAKNWMSLKIAMVERQAVFNIRTIGPFNSESSPQTSVLSADEPLSETYKKVINAYKANLYGLPAPADIKEALLSL